MSYTRKLDAIVGEAAGNVLAIIARFEEGRIDEATALRLISWAIGQGNASAFTLADLAVASELSLQIAKPVAPVGAAPPKDQLAILDKAVGTIAATGGIEDNVERFQRLTRNQVLQSAHSGTADAIRRTAEAKGWVRDTGGQCCQLCDWWSREDRVWPADHPMPTHKGCVCRQRPVTSGNIAPTIHVKKMQERTAAYESWLQARRSPESLAQFRKAHPNYNRQFRALEGAA